MKKLFLIFSIATISLVLSGCALLGIGFEPLTSGASVSGYVYGITGGVTVTIKDDLGESTTAVYSTYNHYYYTFSVKPGVRTLTYTCTGYATFTEKISVIGQTTLNVTMTPIS
ncbi:MAG: hypothetical protein M1542_05160 [Thermotogae bacterium]|jgi:hypothetical protein|nr:hypothetical protein [Thermotogota bacterium]MCL5032622.1 hypothetical protein [Thermotogota bacterium]